MKWFLLFFRFGVYSLLILMIVNALEIFSLTRNWIVFIVPFFCYCLILIIFKILKKLLNDNY